MKADELIDSHNDLSPSPYVQGLKVALPFFYIVILNLNYTKDLSTQKGIKAFF